MEARWDDMPNPYEWRGKRMERVRRSLRRSIDRFNARFPVGSPVQLLMDSGVVIQTKVKHGAFYKRRGGRASAWFEGIASGYHIGCVQAPDGERPFFNK